MGGNEVAGQGFVPVPSSVPADLRVLLITIDALHARHLGAYGYRRPTSPEMDRLAVDGSLFENAWAHTPRRRFAIPSIATGLYPSQIRWSEHAGDGAWGVAKDNPALAAALSGRGMTTATIAASE